jgi:hypothetical protein
MPAEHTAARSAGVTAGDYWTVAALAADKSGQSAMSSSAIRQCSFLLLAITGFLQNLNLTANAILGILLSCSRTPSNGRGAILRVAVGYFYSAVSYCALFRWL